MYLEPLKDAEMKGSMEWEEHIINWGIGPVKEICETIDALVLLKENFPHKGRVDNFEFKIHVLLDSALVKLNEVEKAIYQHINTTQDFQDRDRDPNAGQARRLPG
jgi:hypothetical protein